MPTPPIFEAHLAELTPAMFSHIHWHTPIGHRCVFDATYPAGQMQVRIKAKTLSVYSIIHSTPPHTAPHIHSRMVHVSMPPLGPAPVLQVKYVLLGVAPLLRADPRPTTEADALTLVCHVLARALGLRGRQSYLFAQVLTGILYKTFQLRPLRWETHTYDLCAGTRVFWHHILPVFQPHADVLFTRDPSSSPTAYPDYFLHLRGIDLHTLLAPYCYFTASSFRPIRNHIYPLYIEPSTAHQHMLFWRDMQALATALELDLPAILAANFTQVDIPELRAACPAGMV